MRASDARAAARAATLRRGPLTASAIIASVGNAHEFKNGRQFAAWLGLVPRQYSTGGKTRLGHITRRGDPYLRTLLIMGARAVLQAAARRKDRALALGARACGSDAAITAPASRSPRRTPASSGPCSPATNRCDWQLLDLARPHTPTDDIFTTRLQRA